MSAVKKIRKEAGKGHLVITPRKKGEHVPRKLFLRDGTRLDVLIEERPMQDVIIEKVVTEWEKKSNPHRNIGHWNLEYVRAVSHLPGNLEMKVFVVDLNDIRYITTTGRTYMCLLKMPVRDVKRLARSDAWFKEEEMAVYRVEPSVNLKKFFGYHDWQAMLKLYLTENLDKDWRLVEAFKSVVIPLIPKNWNDEGELSELQTLNNHLLLLTNTKVGKSEWSRILGERSPITEWSSAALLGYFDKGVQVDGRLEGQGIILIDEAMYITGYSEIAIMPVLLGYMQQGSAGRAVKGNVEVHGTKTLVFASNPARSEDVLSSFDKFIEAICGKDYPEKHGGRCGLILVGNDYKTVTPQGSIRKYRDVIHRVIKQAVQKFYYSRIYPVIKANMKWVYDVGEAKNTYEAFSLRCPNAFVRKFIQGMEFSIPKIKMGVIRSLILEHLDELVLSFNLRDFQLHHIEKFREQRFQMLLSINFASFDALSLPIGFEKDKKNTAREIKKRFPDMSQHDIGLFLDEPRTNIERWLDHEENPKPIDCLPAENKNHIIKDLNDTDSGSGDKS